MADLLHDGLLFNIVAPSSLKKLSAQLTYPCIKKGSKLECRNNEGIAGGSFKKPDIYKALIENTELNCEWLDMLRNQSVDILSKTNIPKPIEDINDAKIMYEIVKKGLI